jgi:hypothetical protein
MVDGTKHSMMEALKGQNSPAHPSTGQPEASGRPQPTHEQVAEETRQQEARPTGRPDREDLMINAGRAQQTHG